MSQKIITIGVIAHVDHGKTTLVDALLRQGGAFDTHEQSKMGELIMDSNAQEKERGITITAKNCAIMHAGIKINIVDTPGHADFSSEVERVLKVCDTVLLVVDSQEGPMPQTRFVTQKALALGLRPILVINKIDKPGSNPEKVHDQVFDLFAELGATDEQLDFPMVLAIAREGVAKIKLEDTSDSLAPLFETIIRHTQPKTGDAAGSLQAQVYSLEYDNHLGRIAVARVQRGTVKTGETIGLSRRDGSLTRGRIAKMFVFQGVRKMEVDAAPAGEIVGIAGFADVTIGETFVSPESPEPLPLIEIGEPTVSMTFGVNTSPLAGREGKWLTTRQIRDRLTRELETNVGLKVEDIDGSDGYKVSGRGELHLAVLIESMRREGFELEVGRPQVITHETASGKEEPIELAVITVPDEFAGTVIAKLGVRRGEMKDMISDGTGHTRLEFEIPTRGLIGYSSEFIRDTRGEGTLAHIFLRYDAWRGSIPARQNGVLISQEQGTTLAFALDNLQERGVLFIGPGVEVYEGMIIGENSRDDDLVVNPLKGKKLTNMRASGSDDAIKLTPPRELSLETAIEYVGDDELVEVTPTQIRLRKKFLKEHERKRAK